MKYRSLVYSILVFMLTSCGERLSGESDDAFTASRTNVEANLNVEEKENLEKALRVLAAYAMSEKWNEPEKFEGKSFNAIVLDVVDGKTYSGLIAFVEDYLEKDNEQKKERLQNNIESLKRKRDSIKETAAVLDSIRPSEIKIIKEKGGDPKILVEMVNIGSLTTIKEYMIGLEVFSISKNIKVDGQGMGGSKSSSENYDNNFFAYVSKPLSDLMKRSRRLRTELENAEFPIIDLAKYDLKVEAHPTKITLQDGTVYRYPTKNLKIIDEELSALQEELSIYQDIVITLDELELDEQEGSEAAFNEPYLSRLKKIRNEEVPIKEKTEEIKEDVTFSFPLGYEVKNERFPGTFSMALSDSLVFNSDDDALIQYQIADTTYVEYEHSFDRPNGSLNILEKPHISYDIKSAIESMKSPSGYSIDLIDADDSGYIYRHVNIYRLSRYFRIKGSHYSYNMDFKDLEKCIREFDRSKDMVR